MKLMLMSASTTSAKIMPLASMLTTLTLRCPPPLNITSVSVAMDSAGNSVRRTLMTVRPLSVRRAVNVLTELAPSPASVHRDSSKRLNNENSLEYFSRGRLCEEEIDECMSAPCHPSATCVDEPGDHVI